MTMPRWHRCLFFILVTTLLLPVNNPSATTTVPTIKLPAPRTEGGDNLNQLLQQRRSRRDFGSGPITLAQLSQLLWSAQGITDASGLRTAPSAGALYPLEIYVVAGQVRDLDTGLYHYRVKTHSLTRIDKGDLRQSLTQAALGQNMIEEAAVIITITGDYARTQRKYGSRAGRYVHIEVGHVVQNIYLQATALKLGTVIVGAFEDHKVQQILQLNNTLTPLALMPIGRQP